MSRLPNAALAYSQASALRKGALRAAIRREFAKMSVDDFDASWRAIAPRVGVLVAAAQRGAAIDGATYVANVLAETGQTAPLEAQPVTSALVGVDPVSGAPIMDVHNGVTIEAKRAVALGRTPADALSQAQGWLDLVATTQTIGAAASSIATSIAARPAVTGYIRVLNGPSCSRCTILAGKFHRWSSGFQRHPRCDCYHVPDTSRFTMSWRTDPAAALREGKITDLTIAEKDALDAGADLGQVINAKKTGKFGSMQQMRVEDVYAEAATHAEAIDLLKAYGFIL